MTAFQSPTRDTGFDTVMVLVHGLVAVALSALEGFRLLSGKGLGHGRVSLRLVAVEAST